MQRSPPKHRHDGTSPLPLGMDWSPPPKRWEGRNTIWPHNHQTGWSYCVMIPSWIVQADPGVSNDTFLKSVVFYRIHVGIQSPEGVSSSHGVLKRFSDFLNLYASVKKTFPKKDIPAAPPKHALLRINSNRQLLEERRRGLEEWMGRLLSDIDVSRSALVAAFLELEAAVRSSFQEWNQSTSDVIAGPSSSGMFADFPRLDSTSQSVVSDLGSDIAFDESTDTGDSNIIQSSKQSPIITHVRKTSSESVGSDASSLRGSEAASVTGFISNSILDGSHDNDVSSFMDTSCETLNDAQVILPMDQKNKLFRLLLTLQRRVVTGKTDMEDLIARLNQETAVKEYLNTKVKDLEVELEVTKQKSKETLEQAIMLERERVTQMQWDMDELRRKCSEMESKLKFEQNEKTRVESENTSASGEKELLVQELEAKNEELDSVKRHLEEVEKKSKSDIKVLVKEVKNLRSSQAELKKIANRYSEEKTELQRALQIERQRWKDTSLSQKKLLHECKILRDRLQECGVNLFSEEDDKLIIENSSVGDALDLLATSDNRIGLLLAEAQLLAREDGPTISDTDYNSSTKSAGLNTASMNGTNANISEEEIRKAVTDLFIDNAQLRKELNSITRYALRLVAKSSDREEIEEAPQRKTVLNRFLSS
ncbi:Phox (PX) domain-containing protein [Rhynchospora pubera]|uniref:Phox (PX) domain-containing protein n=1 Tax=Rhynchospora pubera TaxID=906938 RepID=A0AAV8G049_9POAL|nr:Phox (PX) domain-containing protein [Rhynchospora pubera]